MVPVRETIPNTGLKVNLSLIRVIVITVALAMYQRNVLLMAKCVLHVIKRDTLSHIADLDNEARVKANGSHPRHDHHKVTINRDQNDDSNWFQYEQDSVQVLLSRGICSDINSRSNIQSDKIHGKGVQCVLLT